MQLARRARVEVDGDRLVVSGIHVSGSETSHSTSVWERFTLE